MNGRRLVLTSAILVAGLRMWMQLRGKTKTPFGEWAVGWGVTYFFLALISEEYERAAGTLAAIIAVGAFLQNGTTLFKDMTGAVSGGAGFVPTPFTATTTTTAASSSAPTRGAASTGPTAQQVNIATGAA